jgi:HEAT repeat protein
MDSNPEAANIAARSNLPTVIAAMEKPTEPVLLMLAKLQVSDHGIELDSQMPIGFSMSKKKDVVKAGMMNVCIAIAKTWASSFNKLTQPCIESAESCAPFSGLLLGLLLEKGGRMLGLHGYVQVFEKLCASPREDVRAAAVFLLGSSMDAGVAPVLDGLAKDPSPLVREQVVWAIFNFARNQVDRRGLAPVDGLASDPSEFVRAAYETAKEQIRTGARRDQKSPNPILRNLVASVKANGFAERYAGNVFEIRATD